jgi:hypothetical protein
MQKSQESTYKLHVSPYGAYRLRCIFREFDRGTLLADVRSVWCL